MRALLLVALLVSSGPAAAGEIVVVMPLSRTGPHEEALRGVCEALGSCPEVLPVGSALPEDARVVVAIGGDAARQLYPAELALVTALCPGLEARPTASEGPVVRVRMLPAPADFAAVLRSRRPEVKRLALLWGARVRGRYVRELKAVLGSAGVATDARRVDSPDDLPALLRGLPRPDAVWLAPEPELVTPVSYALLKEYAKAEKIVFFVPAAGLGADAADSALAPSFRAVGLRAGRAALDALAGREIPKEAYPPLPALSKPDVAVSTSVPGAR